jgi:hypothetical protein
LVALSEVNGHQSPEFLHLKELIEPDVRNPGHC